MHSSKLWTPSDYISLRDEVDQRGRERYKLEWPERPTEEDWPPDLVSLQERFSTVDLMRALSERGDFDRRRRELARDFVGELRTELYEGRREAFRKTSSGHLELINKDWWASDSASRLLSDWPKSGGDVFLKNEYEEKAAAPSEAAVSTADAEMLSPDEQTIEAKPGGGGRKPKGKWQELEDDLVGHMQDPDVGKLLPEKAVKWMIDRAAKQGINVARSTVQPYIAQAFARFDRWVDRECRK